MLNLHHEPCQEENVCLLTAVLYVKRIEYLFGLTPRELYGDA